MALETLITFITASALLTLMPGPDIIYVLLQSVTNGKKYGFATALGLVSGISIHTLLIAVGLSKIIKQNENLFFTIKLLGALYLFYLAYTVFKASKTISLNDTTMKQKSYISLFKKGFLMNVLNPKVTLFFLAFLPGFINYSQGNIIYQTIILGLLFMFQAIIIFTIVAFIADKLTIALRNNTKFEWYLKYTQIIIFIGIGIFILL